MSISTRALAVAAGLILDRRFGEPPTHWHPVAWFGTAMTAFERRTYADTRARGTVYALVGVGVGAASGRLLGRAAPATAVATAVCVAGRELRSVAAQIENFVLADDLAGAHTALPSLVGRDPTDLDTSQICAAVIESVAENSVDAVVAPVFWGVLLGAPGACAYRAINTMDAMVGHRGAQYGRFGTAAAVVDDVANYVPARIFAVMVAVVQPNEASAIARLVTRDASAHPSPNAGVAETAMAAVLGRELGGPLHYGPLREDRPRLGDGARPTAADVTRAIEISRRVERALTALLIVGSARRLLRRGLGRGR